MLKNQHDWQEDSTVKLTVLTPSSDYYAKRGSTEESTIEFIDADSFARRLVEIAEEEDAIDFADRVWEYQK
jgi:hypothetical protein